MVSLASWGSGHSRRTGHAEILVLPRPCSATKAADDDEAQRGMTAAAAAADPCGDLVHTHQAWWTGAWGLA